MSERIETREKPSSLQIRAGAIAFYYQGFLDEAERTGVILNEENKMVSGVRRFLNEYKALMGGVMPTHEELLEYRDLTMRVAELRKAEKGLSQKDFIKAHRDQLDIDLLGRAANALLIKSYNKKGNGYFENMLKIYTGELSYGIGGDTDREPDENAWASDMLMDKASDRIVEDVGKRFGDREVVLEFGAGSGNFSKKSLINHCANHAKVTDKNPETQRAAKENLENSGLVKGKDFELLELDMRNLGKLKELANELGNKKILIHIGYILHENRQLALDTLAALYQAFSGMDVVYAFSEYFLQDKIIEEVPLDFQGLHYTTQDLFYRDEFLQTVESFKFSRVSETVHNYRSKDVVMNSTTFWTSSK